jgi:prefoldin subunit 5
MLCGIALKHARLLMELAKPIELAPKNGDFVVLQDGCAGSWEVGRWAQESSGWVQIDGKPVRIFPTHWVPVSGDAAGSENSEGLSFLVTSLQPEELPPKRLRTRSILALTAAVIAGFAVFGFGFIGAEPVKDSSFDRIAASQAGPKREVYGERDDAGVIARDLAAAREEIALHIGREDAVIADAVEAKRIADARQTELKRALDDREAKAETLARELASVRQKLAQAGEEVAVHIGRENAARAEALEARRTAYAKQRELDLAVGQSKAWAEALAQSADDITAGTPTVAASHTPSMAITPADAGADPRQSPAEPSQSPPGAISSTDEARLVARAESLIKQSDFSGARLLLEHALEKGSARAAFMMAETYDWRTLRSLQAYGVRGDPERARELYELAAVAGIEQARERLEALKSSSPP